MTASAAERALSAARDDYAHALRALLNAESEAARRRHSRRAQVAAARISEAHAHLQRLTLEKRAA